MSHPAPPSDAEIQAQLERMLDSALFANAPTLGRFLAHVVEHSLQPNSVALKEYTLGLEVFGRGVGFDPRLDTIVRTHARRLRARLEEYYRGPGAADPVVVQVPKGHYRPQIGWRAPAADVAPVAQAPGSEEPRGGAAGARLPAPRSSLVGRSAELSELGALLGDEHVRLLTVTGAGGSGKTRLALQAAWDGAARFEAGAVFVSLAAATDGPAMAQAVASALGVHQAGARVLEDAIADHLRREIRQPLLLLLDNLEQIPAAATLVGRWLDTCLQLRVLATSRLALRLYGEHEYPLSPLLVPQCDPLPGLEELEANPAVSLFLQRSAAVSREARLTPANARAVAELCCRLDGLPLAIELVSAQAANLSPMAMLARFSGHLDLPAHPARDMPERQRTLRRTIDWSHELLEPAERTLLRRLSVFVGGFDVEAAEAVGDTDGDIAGGARAALDGLASKHLVVPLRGDGDPRYMMLDTLREYALERLAASSERTRVQRAHSAFCLVLAEEGNASLAAREREQWLSRCDLEHDNFRAAIAWLLQHDQHDWAMRMGAALFGYWERREHMAEADAQLRTILERCSPEVDPMLWVRLANFAGAITNIHEPSAEPWHVVERALDVSTRAGDARGVAASLNSLGVHRQFAGDIQGARHWFEQALQACRDIGGGKEIAGALSNLARSDLLLGDCAAARQRLEEALTLFRQADEPILVAWCLNHLADVAVAAEDLVQANALYLQSGAMFQALGDRWGVARSCTDLGHLAMARGDLSQAGQRFAEALDLFVGLRHRRGVAILLEGCAQLLALQRHDEQALVVAGAARQLRQDLAVPPRLAQRARLETAMECIRRERPQQATADCWARGATMPLSAAIDYALAAIQPPGIATLTP